MPPQALLLAIALHQVDVLGIAPGQPQVIQRLLIHREKSHGRAIFGRHIGDGRAVGHRHRRKSLAKKFDEFIHDAMRPKNLRDHQHQIGGRRSLRQFSVQLKSHHLRHDHVNRLAEHASLGLDAAHAPAHHAQAVDHRRVRIGAHQGIGKCYAVSGHNNLREVFQIHLMNDPRLRRHDVEVVKRLLSPLEKFVPFPIALKFLLRVIRQRHVAAEIIHLHRVIDHQIDRHQRIDSSRISTSALHRGPHGGQIDHGRHAGQVLQNHPRDLKWHLAGVRNLRIPLGQPLHILAGHLKLISIAQRALQQHLDRKRQLIDVGNAALGQRAQPVNRKIPRLGIQRCSRSKRIVVFVGFFHYSLLRGFYAQGGGRQTSVRSR